MRVRDGWPVGENRSFRWPASRALQGSGPIISPIGLALQTWELHLGFYPQAQSACDAFAVGRIGASAILDVTMHNLF